MLAKHRTSRLLHLSIFLLLVLLGSCRDSPFGPQLREAMAVLHVSANVAGTSISTLVVEVTAADIPTPLVFNLEIAEGMATGALQVPVGRARTFTARAFDTSGEMTHDGSSAGDVKEGVNPPIQIVLVPRSGQVPIIITVADYSVEVTPAEASLEMGDTLRLRATIRDAEGHAIAGQVQWATLNPALAEVGREGLVSARRAGTVQIVASYAGVAGSAQLTIGGGGSTSGQIAFDADLHGTYAHEIYLISANGSNLVNLTDHPASDRLPVWSPSGGRIAFISDRDGNGEIYVMNADGSNLVNLTNHPAGDGRPVWSPNGSRIAFLSDRDRDVELPIAASEIYVMNTDGSNVRRLTDHPTRKLDFAWSPDGSRIAFYGILHGNAEIFMMNADGSALVNLTDHPAWDLEFAWSPDGSRIAFRSNRDGEDRIYVMNADGSNVRRLTHPPAPPHRAQDSRPVWSPDGGKIAFERSLDGVPDIYVMDADGSNAMNLTNHPEPDHAPAWSPDGSRISFRSRRDGNFEISVMNADGSNRKRLTSDAGWGGAPPAWRP